MASPKFNAAIVGLCEAFGKPASEARVGAYAIGLRSLTDERVVEAAALALERCKFMPVPAELLELAQTGGAGVDATAEQAFAALREAIQDHGADYSVSFEDGAINAAVRSLGGWQRVCDMPREEFDKWFRKDFIACYVGLVRSGASVEEMRYLAGNLERDNARWEGRINPKSGTVFRGAEWGGGVRTIGVGYRPALAAPEPEERKAVEDGRGLGLRLNGPNGKVRPEFENQQSLPAPGDMA